MPIIRGHRARGWVGGAPNAVIFDQRVTGQSVRRRAATGGTSDDVTRLPSIVPGSWWRTPTVPATAGPYRRAGPLRMGAGMPDGAHRTAR
jgi:hypothetical protein